MAEKKTGKSEVTERRRRLLPGLSVKDGFTQHPFDAEFGVRTSGLIAGRHLNSGHRHARHATAYFGVAPSVLRALVKRWQKLSKARIGETVFVDLGAGMGRAVLLASELGFKAVVGVELHPALARIARKNVALWHSAGRSKGRSTTPIRVVEADAVEFPLPSGPVAVFLFNPFGAAVLGRLLKRWHGSMIKRSEPLHILYVNNEQEGVLENARRHGWTRLFLGKVPRSKADAIADHKIMANQPEGEYASSNWEDCSIWEWERSDEGTRPWGAV
jgi:SAM-dependent methyltransferase